MNADIAALVERLQNAKAVDWKATRQEIVDLHGQAATFEERGLLCGLYVAVMDQVERSGTIDDMEAFQKARREEFNLLMVSESITGEHVDPTKLLAVTNREIAAGHIGEDHRLHDLAKMGRYLEETRAAPPAGKSWWSRLFSK